MIAIHFLAEWALRSSILILSGGLLLKILRVKDPSIRLLAWTVMLFGSLAIPAITAALPKVPLVMLRAATRPVQEPVAVHELAPTPARPLFRKNDGFATLGRDGITHFDWAPAAAMLYILVALALLLRLCIGLAMSLRLLRASRATDQVMEGIEIRESDRVSAPVTLGIMRPALMLPADWRQWDAAKLDAVLAHERSHIRRYDPAVQLLSAIHRALLWHSPLSWFLHKRIVRAAEDASDDAAVAATRDRTFYAEVLLDFMQRGVHGANSLGVPMARYGRADQCIRRILDGTTLSRGVTSWSVAAILALGSPLAYAVAAAHPQSAAQVQTAAAPAAPVQAATPGQEPGEASAAALPIPQTVARSAVAARLGPVPAYLNALGYVSAYTVTVKPRVDGQLLSVSFKEGDLVQSGQVLASIDPRPYQIELDQAEGQFAWDQVQTAARPAEMEGRKKADQAKGLPQNNIYHWRCFCAMLDA